MYSKVLYSKVLYKEFLGYKTFEFFVGTKAPTQMEGGNSRLSTRFLEHHPVTSPQTNQKKVCTPCKIKKMLISSLNDPLFKNFYG